MEPEDYERTLNEIAGHSAVTDGINENAKNQMQYYLEEKEKGIVDIQLEVESIKSDIYHLLRQDVYRETNGIGDWREIEDVKKRTLSDWGVDRIMQIIHFYVNKNTLLSNFDVKQIDRIMLKFMKELNDIVLLKYQLLFRNTSFEECKEIMLERISEKEKIKLFSNEILGLNVNKEDIHQDMLNEVEKNLEQEIYKIREEQRKEKLREYGLLLAQLEIVVYSTLNRAYRGEERGSIRRHTTISELIGGQSKQQPQRQGGLFSWGRN